MLRMVRFVKVCLLMDYLPMKGIIIIEEKTILSEILESLFKYEDYVKGVVDINKNRLAIGGEWHSDAEQILSESGSSSNDNWGFNIYFENSEIVYNSMINIKPQFGFKSMEITDENLKVKILNVISEKLDLSNLCK
jgi:Protein of unknown function (DUF5674)